MILCKTRYKLSQNVSWSEIKLSYHNDGALSLNVQDGKGNAQSPFPISHCVLSIIYPGASKTILRKLLHHSMHRDVSAGYCTCYSRLGVSPGIFCKCNVCYNPALASHNIPGYSLTQGNRSQSHYGQPLPGSLYKAQYHTRYGQKRVHFL